MHHWLCKATTTTHVSYTAMLAVTVERIALKPVRVLHSYRVRYICLVHLHILIVIFSVSIHSSRTIELVKNSVKFLIIFSIWYNQKNANLIIGKLIQGKCISMLEILNRLMTQIGPCFSSYLFYVFQSTWNHWLIINSWHMFSMM